MYNKNKIIKDLEDRIKCLEVYREQNWTVMEYTRKKYERNLCNLIMFTQKAIADGEIKHEFVEQLGGLKTEFVISYKGKTVNLRKQILFLPTGLKNETYYISLDGGTEIQETVEGGDIEGLFEFADKTYGARHLTTILETKDKKAKK